MRTLWTGQRVRLERGSYGQLYLVADGKRAPIADIEAMALAAVLALETSPHRGGRRGTGGGA